MLPFFFHRGTAPCGLHSRPFYSAASRTAYAWTSQRSFGIDIDSIVCGVINRPHAYEKMPMVDAIITSMWDVASIKHFALRAELELDGDQPSAVILPQRLELASPWSIACVQDCIFRISAESVASMFQYPEAVAQVVECALDITFPRVYGFWSPVLPALTQLCVVIPYCGLCNPWGSGSAFDVFDTLWECAALQDLHISYEHTRFDYPRYRHCQHSCIVSLTQLTRFIREHLAFSAPRLRTLSVSGCRCDPAEDTVAAVAALHEIAELVDLAAPGPLNASLYDVSDSPYHVDGMVAVFDGPTDAQNGPATDMLARVHTRT